MLLGILKETAPGETRVALLPESLKSLLAQGITVVVESGAGKAAGASDDAYTAAGATVTGDRPSILAEADLLPVVNAPSAADQALLKPGAVVIGFLRPLDAPAALATAIALPVTLFSMELVPRISRAQSMDALSSMATVAGYKAVINAAELLPRLFPMLMTAAGTIPPARVFVIGAGVAGLQAIATARRLGAVVEAYDVRAAAGEQVRSLGAKFLDVDLGGHQYRRRRRLRCRADGRSAGPRPRPDHPHRRALRRRSSPPRRFPAGPLRASFAAMPLRPCAPARCWWIWPRPLAATAN